MVGYSSTGDVVESENFLSNFGNFRILTSDDEVNTKLDEHPRPEAKPPLSNYLRSF